MFVYLGQIEIAYPRPRIADQSDVGHGIDQEGVTGGHGLVLGLDEGLRHDIGERSSAHNCDGFVLPLDDIDGTSHRVILMLKCVEHRLREGCDTICADECRSVPVIDLDSRVADY